MLPICLSSAPSSFEKESGHGDHFPTFRPQPPVNQQMKPLLFRAKGHAPGYYRNFWEIAMERKDFSGTQGRKVK
jgi:hypothetical protein